ncbi:hypothetical protein DAPPUDRAFT_345434 [Daphnia pulex]|uniref:Uncharacterized protein n=1 Tax=Daphnia pulex TaxID=6669 RepID=E9I7E5_DAPPU|nr:hypothetical protein DAPPUDRAFT_345434 [Daphnia pulex]|eukprot:EFX60085.1 hypothetical protein DAPPUDRAFT_345434 [Daphnia pulex]
MLMNNQSHNTETYVSPFSKRDAMKDTLIDQNIEDERKRYQLFDVDSRKREQERKNVYRNELLDQIEERKRKEYLSRHNLQKEKE